MIGAIASGATTALQNRATLGNKIMTLERSFREWSYLDWSYCAYYADNAAKKYDDGLDGDFIEEEWQFVRDNDDEDDDLNDVGVHKPSFYIDEDDDEEDEDDVDYADEEDAEIDDNEDDEDVDEEDLEEWFSEDDDDNYDNDDEE